MNMDPKPRKPIYLDHHATTPCAPEVIDSMLPYFRDFFGNPSSSSHEIGRHAVEAVDTAREQVAELIGARAGEVFFTSGATESNNLAIQGITISAPEQRRQIVISAIEHKSVSETARRVQKHFGKDVQVVPVDRNGRVDLGQLKALVSENTLVVSIQAASNEVGTIQDIASIAEIVHTQGSLLHCDAAQAVGKIVVDVEKFDVDLLSLSAHKMYGPKGIGALYVRGGLQKIYLEPLMSGGGQERGLRPGTINVPAVVGLGCAAQLTRDGLTAEMARIGSLRDELERLLIHGFPALRRNGHLPSRLPGNCNITFPGIESDALIANLPDLAFSTGSACTSAAPEPSSVLLAMGLTRDEAFQTVRLCLGRYTTADEVAVAAKRLIEATKKLAALAQSGS